MTFSLPSSEQPRRVADTRRYVLPLLLCAEHAGVLARLGFTSPLPVSDRWAAMWLHVGGYLVLAAAFALEYDYRRWRLRHLSHPGLHDMLLKLMLQWPQLTQGKAAATR